VREGNTLRNELANGGERSGVHDDLAELAVLLPYAETETLERSALLKSGASDDDMIAC
jgi:hypothetical protein